MLASTNTPQNVKENFLHCWFALTRDIEQYRTEFRVFKSKEAIDKAKNLKEQATLLIQLLTTVDDIQFVKFFEKRIGTILECAGQLINPLPIEDPKIIPLFFYEKQFVEPMVLAANDPLPELQDCPDEILLNIFEYLNIETIIALKKTNTRMYNVLSTPSLWQQKFKLHFPHLLKKVEKSNRDIKIDWEKAFITAYNEDYKKLDKSFRKIFSSIKDSDLGALKDKLELWMLQAIKDETGDDLLYWALKINSQEVLDHIFHLAIDYYSTEADGRRLIDVKKTDDENFNLLRWAIVCKQPFKIIKDLIDAGSDIHLKSSHKGNPIITSAIYTKQVDTVEYLLNLGVDVNSLGQYQNSLLLLAVSIGNRKIFDLILKKNPNLDIRNCEGTTAIETAVYLNRIDMFETLLKAGANFSIQNKRFPLLHMATFSDNEKILKTLIDLGIKVDMRNKNNETACMIAAEKGKKKSLQFLLKAGADINAKGKADLTPFLYAARGGQKDTLNFLYQKHVDIYAKTNDGFTALTLAAANGHTDVVIQLLEYGVDINECSPLGTAFLANTHINSGSVEVAKVLIDAGANLEEKNDKGDTALTRSIYKGHYDLAEWLIKKGATLEAKDKYGNTALLRALENKNYEYAKRLIIHGANPYAENIYGQTPLHIVTKKGQTKLVELLLNHGAHPGLRDIDEKTALHYINYRQPQAYEILKLFLNGHKKVNVNSRTALGNIPLHFAVCEGNVDAVRLLLENGANPYLKNNDGLNAIEVAVGKCDNDPTNPNKRAVLKYLMQVKLKRYIETKSKPIRIFGYNFTFFINKKELEAAKALSQMIAPSENTGFLKQIYRKVVKHKYN